METFLSIFKIQYFLALETIFQGKRAILLGKATWTNRSDHIIFFSIEKHHL